MSSEVAGFEFAKCHPFAPEKAFLHSSPDQFVFEPIAASSSKSSSSASSSFAPSCLRISRTGSEYELCSERPHLPSPLTTEEIYGIVGVARLLAGRYLIVITHRHRVGKLGPNGAEVHSIAGVRIVPFDLQAVDSLSQERRRDEDRYLAMLKRVFATKHFYFSTELDITSRLQRLHERTLQEESHHRPIWERADNRFFWNRYLAQELIGNKIDGWVLPVMLGYTQIASDCDINGFRFDYALISRRNVKRAGTRYHMRGIDEEGNVANNVETEQLVIAAKGGVYSFVQTRGSIPVFWDQTPNIKYQPRPVVRPDPKENEKAFLAHFEDQTSIYKDHVAINLINQHGSEGTLAQAYEKHARLLDGGVGKGNARVRYIAFDFHHHCKKMKWENLDILLRQVAPDVEKFGFFAHDGKTAKQQIGTFRTNCIDNLDRTNVVQSLLAKQSLTHVFHHLGVFKTPTDSIANYPQFKHIFNDVWANNADTISSQYTGTGALKTDFTRTGKRTLKGALNDGLNSITRYYLNNFSDGFRQDAYDLFLGNYVVRPTSRSPFAQSFRPIATTAFCLAMVIGIVMFLASLFNQSGSFFSQVLTLCFWLGAIFASWKILLWFGKDIVDKPQLVPRSKPKAA